MVKYYFCEYIILFLTWFKVFLVEASLFPSFIKLRSELNYPSDYHTSPQFKNKFKIEIEPKVLLLY